MASPSVYDNIIVSKAMCVDSTTYRLLPHSAVLAQYNINSQPDIIRCLAISFVRTSIQMEALWDVRMITSG